jgi:Lrp/AsnC family transcriptional regulator, leucine-responsive regulatory protein
MKLTDKEAEILACVELRADLPIAEIAAATGHREHTIRYHLKSLEERGIIRRAPLINIAPAGYNFFGIYFSAAAKDQDAMAGLIDILAKDPQVFWLAEMGGDYQYGFAICVRHVYEVRKYLHRRAECCPDLFFQKSVAAQFSATAFYRKYLCAKKFANPPLTIAPGSAPLELDDIDRRILGGMVRLDYRSNRQLAQLLGMPLSSLDLRVKKLEEKGIILGYVYKVDPEKIGMQEHVLLIHASGLSPQLEQALRRYAEEHPAVTYMYECLGSWDFELNVEVTSGQEVAAISRDITERFQKQINTVKALAKYRDLKLSFVPF